MASFESIAVKSDLTPLQVAGLLQQAHAQGAAGAVDRGERIVGQLKKKFKATTDRDLQSVIGLTVPGIQQ